MTEPLTDDQLQSYRTLHDALVDNACYASSTPRGLVEEAFTAIRSLLAEIDRLKVENAALKVGPPC